MVGLKRNSWYIYQIDSHSKEGRLQSLLEFSSCKFVYNGGIFSENVLAIYLCLYPPLNFFIPLIVQDKHRKI